MDRWKSVWLCRDGLRNDEILLVSTFENMETRMSLLFFSEPMSFYVFRVTPIPYFFPVWSLAVWNTACISASVTQGYYRGNINGHVVWEIKDFDGNFFKNVKV